VRPTPVAADRRRRQRGPGRIKSRQGPPTI